MLDTIIVGVVITIAAVYVIGRLAKQFSAKTPACGCSGCGKSANCSGAGDRPDSNTCGSQR